MGIKTNASENINMIHKILSPSDESLEIYDSQGNLLGQTQSRKKVHQTGSWHKTVHVWIINDTGEILLQKRAVKKESYPGLWDVSAAGHIISGQSNIESAQREVFEELGVKFEKINFQYLFTLKSQVILNHQTFIDNEFNDIFLLKTCFAITDFKINPIEVSDLKYVTLHTLNEMIHNDNIIVPHNEEYLRILSYLQKNQI